MAKFTYRNKTDQPQTLMGFGRVQPGETIDTDEAVENPNFALVDNRRLVGVEGPVKQPEPNANIKKGKNK